MNAFRPSWASCEPIACCTAGRVQISKMLVASGIARLAMAASFVALTASGLQARMVSARRKAPSMASPSTTSLTTPMRSASAAASVAPVRSRPIACFKPSSCVMR